MQQYQSQAGKYQFDFDQKNKSTFIALLLKVDLLIFHLMGKTI
jgi:hypothetical protein